MRLEDARREILNRIGEKIGFVVEEGKLSPTTRQAITSLANIWRYTIFMKQLAMTTRTRAEKTRTYRLLVGAGGIVLAITLASIDVSLFIITLLITIGLIYYLGKEYQKTSEELNKLLEEINSVEKKVFEKIDELSHRVQNELKMGWITQSVPTPQSHGPTVVELRCPNCGAPLPMPTSSTIQCKYCGTVITVRDIGFQLKSLIDTI